MPAAFRVLCCCLVPLFSGVIGPASGKPLHASPWRVSAVAGSDVVLPCRVAAPVAPSRGITAVEWSRVDGASLLTLLVVRDGEELVREKAPEYLGRTAAAGGGALQLLGVQRRDGGTYRCVLLSGPSAGDEAFVSLVVAEVSEVHVSVRRTPANELLVLCESGGWSPEPAISLLDAGRNALAARTESSVRPDGLHSVRALVSAAKGNGTLICRVEIPDTSLAKESKIYITDEFDPPAAGPGPYLVLALAVMLVCVVTAVLAFVVPLRTIKKLRSSLRRLTAFCIGLVTRQTEGEEDQPLLEEYGDVTRVETTGASEDTARANHLCSRGMEASHELAARDRTEMSRYSEVIFDVGETLGVHPALIAAIISKQSRAGTQLRIDGYGQFDPHSFGLMQINERYHAVKGNPFSRDHVDHGVTILIQLVKTMRRTRPAWTKEQQLKGALACYIAGEDRVIPLAYEDVDSVTPYGDFANDVVARAQWFARNGF